MQSDSNHCINSLTRASENLAGQETDTETISVTAGANVLRFLFRIAGGENSS